MFHAFVIIFHGKILVVNSSSSFLSSNDKEISQKQAHFCTVIHPGQCIVGFLHCCFGLGFFHPGTAGILQSGEPLWCWRKICPPGKCAL